jgi:anti-sigma factor RsiW
MTPAVQDNHLQPEELNAFIDGEPLTPGGRDIRQHLEACHRCAWRAVTATQLKAATARAGQRFSPSPEVLARLTASLRTPQNQEPQQSTPHAVIRRASFRPAAAWWALAAAVLLVVSLASLVEVRQARQSNAVVAELLDQHLAAIAGSAAPQVISSDRHTVKPWFQGRLPFSFNLPEPNTLPPDTILRGADLVYLEDHPAALLLFNIHKHQVSVFVTQSAGGFTVAPRATRSGFAVRSATAAELRLTAVSDVNPTELEALLRSLAAVQ